MTPLSILMISHHRRHKAHGRSHAMAKSLVQRGHKVTLMVISERRRFGVEETEWDRVRVIESPDMLWGRLRSGWDIWDMLNRMIFLSREKARYDLVHCFETRPATIYPALYYLKHHKIPLLTDWNDWFGRGGIVDMPLLRPRWYRILFGWLETYYEEAFRKRGDGLTVISTALARRASALGIAQDRICLISGGAFPELVSMRSKEECRSRMGFSHSAPIICFSSGDSHIDMGPVMAAVANVAGKYPSVKLMITGKIGRHVLDQAEEFGIRQNLYLTGFVPFEELEWYMGCADVFVLPFPKTVYNAGRWPNKLGDYLCAGRPTISNPVGDVKTFFENNEIGLLADFDQNDFYAKIIYIIENPELALRYGENARKVAEDVLDWKIKVKELEDFYYRVINLH